MSVESTPTDPYEVVLADLRAKKAQIEQAISAIEGLHGGASIGASTRSPTPNNQAPNADIDSPGAFLGMSIADAAKKLLAVKRQPLKNPDIAAAFKRGGLVLNSKDVVNTIGSVLTRRANEVGDLVKVDRGTWGLKEWYPNRSFKKPTVEARDATEKDGGGAEAYDLEELLRPSSKAPVPIVITQDMRQKLREYGANDDDIRAMSPEEAQSYIKSFE